MYEVLTIFAVVIFLYSATGGGLERTPFGGAVAFAACGMLLGPLGLGIMDLNVDAEGLRALAEMTLALVLFIDAANADLAVLGRHIRIPRRMLLVGLPLTILLGFAVGVVMFDSLSMIEVALLATMLAPTDAALGKAVVTNESVPLKIRESLNVESGLNDGICVPILFVFIALAAGVGEEGSTTMLAMGLVAEEIGIGLAVGLGLTFLGGRLLVLSGSRGWISETWRQLPVIALAIASFSLAQWLGGSGFIACFAGGMLFGGMAKIHRHRFLLAAEGTGDTLALITWVIFGAAVVGKHIGSFSWEVVSYALLSLTLIRMLPVFLVLTGTGLRTDEKLFAGWFGPRGLASIVFGVIVLNENLPGGGTITITVVCTILFSVVGHGLSANPLIAALAAKMSDSGSAEPS